MKKCLDFLTEEQAKDWIKVPGAIVLDDWRPFSYKIMLFDYNDIVETAIAEAGCTFLVKREQFNLLEDERFTIKIVKISKFNYENVKKLVIALNDSVKRIRILQGSKYEDLYDKIVLGLDMMASGEL